MSMRFLVMCWIFGDFLDWGGALDCWSNATPNYNKPS